MTKKKAWILLLSLSLVFILKAKENNRTIENIFSNTRVNFDPSTHADGVNKTDSTIILGNGRIVLKKVRLPQFTRNTDLIAEITFVSNGDP